MYITNVEIRNFRCYKSATLELRYPGEARADNKTTDLPNVNVLLGDNGSGKSSILKALALAVTGPIIRDSGFRPYFLVNRGNKDNKATVDANAILHDQDVLSGSKAPTIIEASHLHAEVFRRGDYESIISAEPKGRASKNIYLERSPAFFIAGYGATRRVDDSGLAGSYEPNNKARSERYQRVAGLFEPQIALVALASWLPRLRGTSKSRFAEIKSLLNRLLPEEVEFTGKMIDRDFSFAVRGQEVPFAALSDGYRAYVGWICDLLYHLDRTCPKRMKLIDSRGLVVVDEVDLHLHPLWQRTVIKAVSTGFPKLQFVFTTHSPLIAASLEHENIFITDIGPNGQAVVRQSDEGIYGLSADQTLESSYFGVPSTRPIGFLEEVNQLVGDSDPKNTNAALALMDRISGVKSTKEDNHFPPGTRRIKGSAR